MVMKKEVRNYLSIGFLVLAVLVLAYLLNLGITGFAVFEQYKNQTACEDAGYVWENLTEQNCTTVTTCINETIDCEPCLEYEDLNGTQGDCINWSFYIEENCTDEEDCVEIVIGGQCIGDVCDSEHLDLCLTSGDCGTAEGYWYDANEDGNSTCNAEEELSCSNDNLNLCLTEEGCTDADGYWYDGICSDECTLDDQCDSGYECSDGSCVKIATEEPEELKESPPPISFTSSEILPLSINPGSSQESSVIIKNTGEIPLSGCMLKLMGGEFDSWISVPEEIININPNEEQAFSFSVTVPEGTAEDSYSLKIATQCLNMYQAHNFVVNVVEKKLEFDLISADRTRDDRVRVLYSLEELAGEDQDVVFIFSLVDINGVEVGRVEVNQSIDANSSDEFRTNININESLLPINETTNETLESELTLNVNFNSQIYSSSIQEKVLIGAPIGGFAIFEGVGAGEAIIFVVVLLVLVFIFIFARRMRRKGKTLRDVVGRAKPASSS